MNREICLVTGEKCIDGSPFAFTPKKMCVNCVSCAFSEEDGTYTCINEEHKASAREKILEAIKNAGVSTYSVENVDSLELKPIPLKKPTAKCPKWAMNRDLVYESIAEYMEGK